MQIDSKQRPYTLRRKLTQIIDLNVKCKAIKLVRQNLNDLGFDGDFLDKTIIYNHQNL